MKSLGKETVMRRSPLHLLVLLLALAGCEVGDMHPGAVCGSCHKPGDAPVFGAAGTVYLGPTASGGLSGATVDITDARGVQVALESNEAGNFYTPLALAPPLRVTLSQNGASASTVAPSGDCNSCHSRKTDTGRLRLPSAAAQR